MHNTDNSGNSHYRKAPCSRTQMHNTDNSGNSHYRKAPSSRTHIPDLMITRWDKSTYWEVIQRYKGHTGSVYDGQLSTSPLQTILIIRFLINFYQKARSNKTETYIQALNLFFEGFKDVCCIFPSIPATFDLKSVHGIFFKKITFFPWTRFKSKFAGIDGKIQQTSLKP